MTPNKTILVIDDSSTIRRLVDSTLTRDGYSVVLAPTAEDGVRLAGEVRPDAIVLDHQLPGTTGLHVCEQLVASPVLANIPVVISSTLRNKAYVEYADMPNVVDMLPKPYTEDLLLTTVSNAVDNGGLIVASQAGGTAVPEVIAQQGEADLNGTFNGFTVREVIDFLNNGRKGGTLEVEGDQVKYLIHLRDGRVVGISATGIEPDDVVSRLPESLQELSAVVKVTMGRKGGALDSIVDLLNTQVLDPRLLRKLLRHQAAALLVDCFGGSLKSFRFLSDDPVPGLFERLPLDVSVLALLVEGALTRRENELPPISEGVTFSRCPIRGQNLDRAGLSAKQTLVLGQLQSARTLNEVAAAIESNPHETRAILYGFELADLIESRDANSATRRVIVFESDSATANSYKQVFENNANIEVTVVNDATAARLLARRTVPDVMVVDATDESSFAELRASLGDAQVIWVATSANPSPELQAAAAVLPRPLPAEQLGEMLNSIVAATTANAPAQQAAPAAPVATQTAPVAPQPVPAHDETYMDSTEQGVCAS